MACFIHDDIQLLFNRSEVQYFSQDEQDLSYVVIDDMVLYVEDGPSPEIKALPGNKWPGGVVYYQFAASLSEANKTAFKAASKLWSDVARVSFVERADPGGYVLVEASTVNRAALGFQRQQGQIFQIVSWNNLFVIAHEIAHALGMVHEHMRADRDSFVRIHSENIEVGAEGNFSPSVNFVSYSTYDYESVMHYSRDAFGIVVLGVRQRTISIRPPNLFDETKLGQRSRLSELDKLDMARHYGSV